MKAANPQTKIYCYYALSIKATVDADGDVPNAGTVHQLTPVSKAAIAANDWWLRDGNGALVQESSTSTFLDVGKPGFKEAYLNALLSRLSGRNLSGVVLDYWTGGLSTSYLAGFMKNRPFPAAYPTDMDWYTKAWQPFISYVTSGLRNAGYRVIGNCAGEYNSGYPKCDWQRTQVDGTVYEQWAVDWPANHGAWLSGKIISNRINHMYQDPLEVWTADYGLRRSDPIYSQKVKVGVAMYYIAIPPSQALRSYNHAGNLKIYWESIWDFKIGTPAAPFVKLPNNYFWSRKYTQGLVLLNYESTTSITYKLDRTYLDSDGNILSGTITVPPHTGIIMANSN